MTHPIAYIPALFTITWLLPLVRLWRLDRELLHLSASLTLLLPNFVTCLRYRVGTILQQMWPQLLNFQVRSGAGCGRPQRSFQLVYLRILQSIVVSPHSTYTSQPWCVTYSQSTPFSIKKVLFISHNYFERNRIERYLKNWIKICSLTYIIIYVIIHRILNFCFFNVKSDRKSDFWPIFVHNMLHYYQCESKWLIYNTLIV